VTDVARKTGMAEAPAAIQAAGVACQLSDARLVGKQENKKEAKTVSIYEVACGNAMGFMLEVNTPGTARAFTCVEMNYPADGGAPKMACVLPGNQDPKAHFAPVLASAKVACTPQQIRGLGQTTANTLIEVSCAEGVGYIVSTSVPFDASKPVKAENCLAYDAANVNLKCTLSDAATRLQVVDRWAQQAGANCAVKQRRYIGRFKDESEGYEASCQDGKGYFLKVANNKAQATDCAKAPPGICELTDTRTASAEQAGLYTRLAKNAGSDCTVDKYALFPARGSEEIVELVCKDGKSMLGMFPASGKGQVLDCGRALAAGYKCTQGKVDYAGLTADLRKFDQKTCSVSNASSAGRTQKGTILVEVACSDGFKGYMIEYQTTPAVTAVGAMGCSFTGNCKLPGNTYGLATGRT
jgi:hypothetical protein